MERGIKKAGDQISGEGTIGPQVNAEDRSRHQGRCQLLGPIGNGQKLGGRCPRHSQHELVKDKLLAVSELKQSDSSAGFIHFERFHRGGGVKFSPCGLKKNPQLGL